MQHKPYAFVPDWIVKVLRRNNLKLEDLLYFERIRPFFSAEDLASLVCCSDLSKFFIGRDVNVDTHSWVSCWLDSVSDDKKQSVRDILALSNAEEVKEETLTRLAQVPESAKYEKNRESFTVALVGDFGVFVVINSGFTAAQRSMDHFKITQCTLKKLYVYEEHHSLMARPLGRVYIESLLQ